MAEQNGTQAQDGQGTARSGSEILPILSESGQDEEVATSIATENSAETSSPVSGEDTEGGQATVGAITDPGSTGTGGSPSADQAARIAGLQASLEQAQANGAREVEALEAQIGDLQAAAREAEEAHKAALAQAQANAAARYRELVLSANPDVPPELVDGATVEQVQSALETARAVVQRVRDQLAARALAQVSAGAAVRQGPDVDGMSARDKIRYALSQRRK
ncbi:MAG: hypothetical protein HY688_01105 [Chloroflexi bacterium]|nr:hypothetical protein [Chloroflexota bacterium]